MQPIVFFDLDGTILHGLSSENRFILHLLKNRRLGIKQISSAFLYLFKWAPRFKQYIFVKNKAYLTDLSVQNIEALAKKYVQTKLAKLIRPALVAKIKMHQAKGDHVILLTGSPDFLANELAKYLNISEIHATVLAKHGDIFTNLPPLQHPYAEEKLLLAKNICQQHNCELSQCYAYGNSIHDFILLKNVGHPVAVTPDRKLRKKATELNWEIINTKQL